MFEKAFYFFLGLFVMIIGFIFGAIVIGAVFGFSLLIFAGLAWIVCTFLALFGLPIVFGWGWPIFLCICFWLIMALITTD